MERDFHLRIDTAKCVIRRSRLATTDVLRAMNDLPLEIRGVHGIKIHNP
jgi:hypothetical protein